MENKRNNRINLVDDSDLIDYLRYLKNVKGYSKMTLISYGEDIASFLLFLKEAKTDKGRADKETVRLFLLDLRAKEISHSSVKRYLSALKGFYNFLCKYKEYSENPFESVVSPKKEKKLPSFLTASEMFEFLNLNEKRSDELAKRDQAILELMFASGLRASEVISCRTQDFDFSERTLRIIGKGDKERIVPFSRKAKDSILLYIKESRVKFPNFDKTDILFLNKRGEALTERGLEHIISQCGEKSGFSLKVHPHMLRHTFATFMLNGGMDIRVLQELLGHASVSTTAIYTHISLEDLKKTYDECFPDIIKKEKSI